MHQKIRDKMREKIRALDYVMTVHAEEEMESDHLSILDIEEIVLTGRVIEKQKDAETREEKYVVAGKTIDGVDGGVVAKLSATDNS